MKRIFSNWFNYVLNRAHEIPNLNELNHGSSFENEKYSGYNLSLLSVKYLYETLGQEEFKKLMHDNNRIIEYGKTVVQDSIEYYQKKLKQSKNLLKKLEKSLKKYFRYLFTGAFERQKI